MYNQHPIHNINIYQKELSYLNLDNTHDQVSFQVMWLPRQLPS